ncbi:MAG: phenylacetate--CoA ligase family protein [Candidatus Geothermincolia bacterium]
MDYFNEVEVMPRPQLDELKLERLRASLARIYENVPFYKQKLTDAGFEPGDLKSLDDLKGLPFTVKEDLRDHYPFGLFAVPMRDIVRIHASSGTTGNPTVVGYTAKDIRVWADLVARTLVAGMATPDDVIQVAYGYGLFTGGLGLHYGAELLGASVLPISGGNTKRQVRLMMDFGSSVVCCTPSYALNIADEMKGMGIDPSQTRLKSGVLGAEPWTEEMRGQIEAALGISAIDIYGLSELVGPGVAIECQEKRGMHIFEDSFIPEIVDPNTGEVLPPGSVGELVLTNINKEGLSLLRYRTRDISKLEVEPCACGRTHYRVHRFMGRSDDMLVIRGVNVFPSQIEMVLMQVPGLAPHYQIFVDRVNNSDILEVQVEMTEELFSDEIKGLEKLESRIVAEIQTYLGLRVKVTLKEPRSIQRSEGKAVRVIDRRNLFGEAK